MGGIVPEVVKDEVLKNLSGQTFERFKHFYSQLPGSDVDKKLAVDHSFRDVLQQFIVNDNESTQYCSILDFAVFSVKQDVCSPSTFFVMLSDLFDMITIDRCDVIFRYVEEKVDTWKSDIFYNAGKNYLLRMCNDLLRRLSKSKNTIFCGRIQLFLARLFPLEEKSGLNLMSHFNLDNITTYNTSSHGVINKQGENKKDEGFLDFMKAPIDYNLYIKFWSLQDFFRRPTQCYDSTAWRTFVDHAEVVFNCFESYKLDDVKMPFGDGNSSQSFFSKYLTSDKLLNLQLSDSNFRRNALLQFLILFQYLTSHVKFKIASHVLNDDQAAWLKEANDRVFKIISETPPDGAQFAKVIEHILSREDNWNAWKNDGCSSYIRKKADAKTRVSAPFMKNRKRSIALDLRNDHKVIKMGNPELTKLWNLCPDSMAACKSKNRDFVANIDQFFAEATEQLDPKAGIEDQYKLVNNPLFAWKSLKLLANKSPHFFVQQPGSTATSNNIRTTSQYLQLVIGKHASEFSSSNNSKLSEDTEDGSMENEVKKEYEASEDDSVCNDQDCINVEQAEELASLVGDDWKLFALCLEVPDEQVEQFQEQELTSEQIISEIIKLQKDNLQNITFEKVEGYLQRMDRSDIIQKLFGASS